MIPHLKYSQKTNVPNPSWRVLALLFLFTESTTRSVHPNDHVHMFYVNQIRVRVGIFIQTEYFAHLFDYSKTIDLCNSSNKVVIRLRLYLVSNKPCQHELEMVQKWNCSHFVWFAFLYSLWVLGHCSPNSNNFRRKNTWQSQRDLKLAQRYCVLIYPK